MLYLKKERQFLFSLVQDIERCHFDGYKGAHIVLPTFSVKISAYYKWRHHGQPQVVKGKTFILWKPVLKQVCKGGRKNNVTIVLESPNKLELHIEMRQENGNWLGEAYLYNHNKKWRWSEEFRGGTLRRTYCDDFLKYFIHGIEIL